MNRASSDHRGALRIDRRQQHLERHTEGHAAGEQQMVRHRYTAALVLANVVRADRVTGEARMGDRREQRPEPRPRELIFMVVSSGTADASGSTFA